MRNGSIGANDHARAAVHLARGANADSLHRHPRPREEILGRRHGRSQDGRGIAIAPHIGFRPLMDMPLGIHQPQLYRRSTQIHTQQHTRLSFHRSRTASMNR